MEITIKVEVSPSAELLQLLGVLMNPSLAFKAAPAMTKEEYDTKSGDTPKPKAKAKAIVTEEVQEDPEPAPNNNTPMKGKADWGLEDLKRIATLLQTEIEFDVKKWLAKHNAISMSRLNKDEYNDLFNELMKIAGDNNVIPF